jgi:copper resistance protein K
MQKVVVIILLLSSISIMAKETLPHSTLQLKDGAYLHIHDDDTTVMVDKYGNPIKMKDGIEMELEDGSLIMMKNDKVWRHIHRKVLRY